MADYYTYHKEATGKRRKRWIVIILLLVLVLVLGAVGYYWMERSDRAVPAVADAVPTEAVPTQTPATAAPTPVVTYTPERLLPAVDAGAWDFSNSVEKTIDTEFLNTDYRMVALPALGTVSTSYFDTVTFVGDSLTQGLELYDSGIQNAKYCAYKSAGPNLIANNATATDPYSGASGPVLDAIAATQPDYVYVLFGTNSMVVPDSDDAFIAYYDKAIDAMRGVLDPGVLIYVQALPGVNPEVVQKQPGLDNERIRNINDRIANLALMKGCYFVNIREALTNQDGTQIAEYGGPDGIHMQPIGYEVWNKYLANHAAWNRRSLYQGENPYYILGT